MRIAAQNLTRRAVSSVQKVQPLDKAFLRKALIVSLAVLVLMFRPHAVGEVYSLHISVLIMAVAAFYIALSAKSISPNRPKNLLLQYLIYSVVIIQLTVQYLMAGGVFASDGVKFFMMAGLSLVVFSVVLDKPSNSRIFFSGLYGFLFFSCLSVVITSGLLTFGFGRTSLVVGSFNGTGYGNLDVLFPYSLANGMAFTPFGLMPRLTGFFREPGILPAFACWAAAYAHLRRWPLIFSIVPLLASVCSLSTLGVPLAAYTGAMIVLRRSGLRTLSAFLIVATVGILIWPLIYALEYIGLKEKISSQSGSYDARIGAIETAFNTNNVFFGEGPSQDHGVDATVNLIGRIRSVGIFGFFTTMLLHLVPFNTNIFIIGLLPMVATFLLTQPIAGDIGVFALFLSWTAFVPARK